MVHWLFERKTEFMEWEDFKDLMEKKAHIEAWDYNCRAKLKGVV